MAVPAARVPLPLVWHGALGDPGGYADEARAFLLALDRAGTPAAARELRWTDVTTALPAAHREAVDRALARRVPETPHVSVFHVVAQPVSTATSGPKVCRTMFECDSIPPHWAAALWSYDEVWVPTRFNVDAFRAGGLPAARLRELPETIDFELFDPVRTQPLELDAPRRFRFLANFDFTDRKGWDVLLDAWAAAFSPGDDVELVLKLTSLHVAEAEVAARIEPHLHGHATAPITLLQCVLDVAEMPRLYAACDAYVAASRGEGWGRPYMEAMAMGLPTIGSRWSGNLAFMNDANSWLVDGEIVAVPERACTHTDVYRGRRWFEPDRDALVAALREVRAGGAAVASRAAGARDDLRARFGEAAVATRIAELTEQALAAWARRRSRPALCAWRGGWGSAHSLAVVNEGLADALESDGTSVTRLLPDAAVREALVGVASQWPPDFEAPSDGPFVLYQPWEFGEIPAAWAERIRERVDEVWTPSASSRGAFLAAGLAPELVHVVPNGVDLDAFAPDGDAWRLERRAATVFLFVGGTTYRKGIDVLLDAYERAFTADDDVLLVVKGFGAGTFYRGQTAEQMIAAFRARPGAPALLPIDEELPYGALPSLYRAADCVVQPYRGEGFCLPALEALACARPLIVTAGGPTDDFVSDACAWRLPSRRVPLSPAALPAELAPAGGGFVLEPDADALVAAFRAAADPAARAAKASTARAHAERFGWDAAAERARARLAAIAGRTPIRTVAPAVVSDARGLVLAVNADWNEPETWAPALAAYAAAFGPDDDTTLVLSAPDEQLALARVGAYLADAAIDADSLADVALADPAGVGTAALELAADAVVHVSGPTPLRARRVVPPDRSVLRSLLAS